MDDDGIIDERARCWCSGRSASMRGCALLCAYGAQGGSPGHAAISASRSDALPSDACNPLTGGHNSHPSDDFAPDANGVPLMQRCGRTLACVLPALFSKLRCVASKRIQSLPESRTRHAGRRLSALCPRQCAGYGLMRTCMCAATCNRLLQLEHENLRLRHQQAHVAVPDEQQDYLDPKLMQASPPGTCFT